MEAKRWIATEYGGLDVLREVGVELAAPRSGEVLLDIRASGMNPADYKYLAAGDRKALPIAVGYEAAGVIAGIGPDTTIASGAGTVGDEVLAYRITGGYASAALVPADCVFAKPHSLTFAEAANLLLVGTTAADMLNVAGVRAGETILLHGASGAVGVSLLQQARGIGARVIGTASEPNFELIRRFGGLPIAYGPGLVERVRQVAPAGVAAALDAAGTDEAVDASLALVADRRRIVTIVALGRAQREGFVGVVGSLPASAKFRNAARLGLVNLAAQGQLVVPVARTFPLEEARAALELLRTGHPGGKLALVPSTDKNP